MSYGYFAEFYDSFTDDVNYDKIEKFVCSLLSREGINGGLLLDLACGFRVIIVTVANSLGNIRVFELLPKLKTKKYGWCIA